jgi:hypothetical protein
MEIREYRKKTRDQITHRVKTPKFMVRGRIGAFRVKTPKFMVRGRIGAFRVWFTNYHNPFGKAELIPLKNMLVF